MPEAPILTHAIISKVIHDELYQAELMNGKIIFAHPSKALKNHPRLNLGQIVMLEMTPFDFDSARISEIIHSQD